MATWTATRRAILAYAAIGWLGAIPAPARAIGILAVGEIAGAIGSAAEAVGKLAENLRIALVEGLKIWDIGTARLARDRMIEFSKTLTFFAVAEQAPLALTLDTYIDNWEDRQRDGLTAADKANLQGKWAEIKVKLERVLKGVETMLASLNREDGLFVATPAYKDLVETLGGRVNLLGRLRKVDPPMTSPEIARLREVAAAYDVLRANLRKAGDMLDAYVKTI